MNFLVFLDSQAGELEKILSGTKSMLVKELNPARMTAPPVNPGDSLYFLRNQEECDLRVKATVVRALFLKISMDDDDGSHTLKEMQPRLQLTERQYNYWSKKEQVLLVEFTSAQKMGLVRVALNKIADRSGWIPFEKFSQITE